VERAASLARREGADVCDRSRRSVLNWAGATLAGAAAFGFDSLSLRLTEALAKNGVVDLGAGNIALLNYAYALEQLEVAFYTAVMASPYSGMTRYERSVLSDVKGHEIAHREFRRGSAKGRACSFRFLTGWFMRCHPGGSNSPYPPREPAEDLAGGPTTSGIPRQSSRLVY
jgi:hypothetical protein